MSSASRPPKLSDHFDGVVMLTMSNWPTEPRSNRYHYAVRFARELPVYFVQPHAPTPEVIVEPTEIANLSIVKTHYIYDESQATAFLDFLARQGVKKPLIWILNFNYGPLLARLDHCFTVYHATEDLTIDESTIKYFSPEDSAHALKAARQADTLVAVSPAVLENFRREARLNNDPICLPNGCDFEFWAGDKARAHVPQASGRRVAFYQGGINSRLDFELLNKVAEILPDWDFWFAGAVDERPNMAQAMSGWNRLVQRPNVRHLGVLSVEELRDVSAQVDVGIIPFVDDPVIRVSLPLKAFEYVACGLPVVSVPIKSLEEHGDFIYIHGDAAGFAAEIVRLAPTRADPEWLARRNAAARRQDYDENYRKLTVHIDRLIRRRQAEPKDGLNILMLYDDNFSHIKTIQEHLKSLRTHSRHNYYFLSCADNPAWNVFKPFEENWPASWDFNHYDAIVWHYGMPASLADYISATVGEQLTRYRGLKILFIQDEYENTATISDWIRKAGLQLVMTCVPEAGRNYVYPPEKTGPTEFIQTLTGFAPEDESLPSFVAPMRRRETRIGYRGRILPFHYGALGHEKFRIGVRMQEEAQKRGVRTDIEVDDYKRIYGSDWYKFLGSVRATLGTESGANVFDFDGELKKKAHAAREAGAPYEQFHAEHVAAKEGFVEMNQISPKIFEAITLRTALVCFRGSYSGIIEADRHYIPLEKDFSNVDEVFRKLEDIDFLEELTKRAYEEIIESGRYSYKVFVRDFDRIIEQRLFHQARSEIISAPILVRRRGEDGMTPILRHNPMEYMLNDGVLRRPMQRSDLASAMESQVSPAPEPES